MNMKRSRGERNLFAKPTNDAAARKCINASSLLPQSSHLTAAVTRLYMVEMGALRMALPLLREAPQTRAAAPARASIEELHSKQSRNDFERLKLAMACPPQC
jgi:ABC-type hemin transport system ATPase subunit